MRYVYLTALILAVIVALFVRSKSSYYKAVFSEHHLRVVSDWVEGALKKGQVENPTVEDGTVITTDAGVLLVFTRQYEDEYDWIHFSISQCKGPTTHAVGGLLIFLILQLLNGNKCEADFFYTRSGVHHIELRKPLDGEWTVNSIEDSIQKMSSYRPLPLEERKDAG